MGLYNFKPQFVPYILDGTKTHTIRAERKHPAKVGETLHLYTGLRQKGATLLMRVPCVKVEEIDIADAPLNVRPCDGPACMVPQIWIAGQHLSSDERDLLAWRDGFRFPQLQRAGYSKPEPIVLSGCFRLMLQFWRGRLPFHGHIIHWDPKRRIDA